LLDFPAINGTVGKIPINCQLLRLTTGLGRQYNFPRVRSLGPPASVQAPTLGSGSTKLNDLDPEPVRPGPWRSARRPRREKCSYKKNLEEKNLLENFVKSTTGWMAWSIGPSARVLVPTLCSYGTKLNDIDQEPVPVRTLVQGPGADSGQRWHQIRWFSRSGPCRPAYRQKREFFLQKKKSNSFFKKM
jgi:hypothetical protein